jgi:hypothetical protein
LGWPGTCYVAQAGLKLLILLSARIIGLQPYCCPSQFLLLSVTSVLTGLSAAIVLGVPKSSLTSLWLFFSKATVFDIKM